MSAAVPEGNSKELLAASNGSTSESAADGRGETYPGDKNGQGAAEVHLESSTDDQTFVGRVSGQR